MLTKRATTGAYGAIRRCNQFQRAMSLAAPTEVAQKTDDTTVKTAIESHPASSKFAPGVGRKNVFRHQLDAMAAGRLLTLEEVGELLTALQISVNAQTPRYNSPSSGDPLSLVRDIAHFIRVVRRSQPSDGSGWNHWRIWLIKSSLPKCVDLLIQYGSLLSPRDVSTSYASLRTMGLTAKAVQLEPYLLERLPEMDTKAITGVLTRSPSVHLQEKFLSHLKVDDCPADLLVAVAKHAQDERLVDAIKARGLDVPLLMHTVKNTPLQRSLDLLQPVRVASRQAVTRLINALQETRTKHGDDAITSEQCVALLTFLSRGRPDSKSRWEKTLRACGIEHLFEVMVPASLSARQLATAYRTMHLLGFNDRAADLVSQINEKCDIMKPAHKAAILAVAPDGPLRLALLKNLALDDLSTDVLVEMFDRTEDALVFAELRNRRNFRSVKAGMRIKVISMTSKSDPEFATKWCQSFAAEDLTLLDYENVLIAYDHIPELAWADIRRRLERSRDFSAQEGLWAPWHPDALLHRVKLGSAIKTHQGTEENASASALDHFCMICSDYIAHKYKEGIDFCEDEMVELSRLIALQEANERGSRFQFVRHYVRLFHGRMEHSRQQRAPDSTEPLTRWSDFGKLATALRPLANLKRQCPEVLAQRSKDLDNLRAHVELVMKELGPGLSSASSRDALNFLADYETLCGRIDDAVLQALAPDGLDDGSAQDLVAWWILLQGRKIPTAFTLPAESVSALTFDEICTVVASIGMPDATDACPTRSLLHERLLELYNTAVEDTRFPPFSAGTDRYMLERLSTAAQLRYADSVERLQVLHSLVRGAEEEWYGKLLVETLEDAFLVLRATAVMGAHDTSTAREKIDAAFMTLLKEPCSPARAVELVSFLTALPTEWARSVDVNVYLAGALNTSHKATICTWSWWNSVRLSSPTVFNVLQRHFPELSATFRSNILMDASRSSSKASNSPDRLARSTPHWLAEFIEQEHGSTTEHYQIPETPLVACMAVEPANMLVFVEDPPRRFENFGVDKMLTRMGWSVQRKTEHQWREHVNSASRFPEPVNAI
eukprot:GEMP01010098.1.p1 GENE.GEMP01010098.1~~GEMP01010098.1.p1  ORF type:complete len:1062 (-),score=261.45 GEMP01010098.1:125-3310(-)